MSTIEPSEFDSLDFALYTFEGGLARFEGDLMVWYEVPSKFKVFKTGDPVPEDWDFGPANIKAARALRALEFGMSPDRPGNRCRCGADGYAYNMYVGDVCTKWPHCSTG